MRLVVLVRHGHSVLNLERRVNGDPGRPVPLTAEGEAQARLLGEQLANQPFDVCIHTRFDRTRRTAGLALAGRDVPYLVEPLLDDIDVGDLEGVSLDEYRAFKRAHTREDRFPGGESLDDAASRYAAALRRLAEADWDAALVVCHEIPIRYALNGSAGSASFDGPVHDVPNATPYLFARDALLRAAARIDSLVATG